MNEEELVVLYRHWIWADLMKANYIGEIEKSKQLKREPDFRDPHSQDLFAYLFIWYRLLYSVLHALKNHGVKFSDIDSDISKLYPLLKECRNATFHPQPKYFSKKLISIIMEKGAGIKVLKVHKKIGDFFQKEVRKGGITNLATSSS